MKDIFGDIKRAAEKLSELMDTELTKLKSKSPLIYDKKSNQFFTVEESFKPLAAVD